MEQEEINQVVMALAKTSVPIGQRAQHMVDIMAGIKNEDEDNTAVGNEVFNRLKISTISEETEANAQALESILNQLEAAPLRLATFIQLSEVDGSRHKHALVTMENGEYAFVVIHDMVAAKKLNLGDRVMIDAHMKLLMNKSSNEIHCGSEARFERQIDDRHIEVIGHQDDKMVLLCSKELIGQMKAGKVVPGASIVVSAQGKFGLYALPPEDNQSTYHRFLDRGGIPDVVVDRDIGSPPKIIRQVELHIREEMTRPELRRKFRLRPCITRLLQGVSGTGKTLAVCAMHRIMYEIMSDITGTPMNELPPRVFRIKSSKLLSMWFGESDKNVDKLFDEVEQLADRRHVGRDGREHLLPVMVVLEEADGLGRARGGETIYDRIMTVILQRLDPNREGLANKLVVFLSTTNEPGMVDPAFLRRIGGSVEVFGRLNQQGFGEILKKHLDGLPLEKSPKSTVASVNEWLFGDPDRGVVELTYQGQGEPELKKRRDFLTGALIDRAVQSAATQAWELCLVKDPDSGITPGMIAKEIDAQVASVVHQLHPDNIHRYTDLPDGTRVTKIKRIAAPQFS